MTKFNIASFEQYIEHRSDLRVLLVLHDNFDRHETYVLAKRKSDDLVLTLVYVAGDLSLDIVEHANEMTALCYLLEVNEHTNHALEAHSNSEVRNLRDLGLMLAERSQTYLNT